MTDSLVDDAFKILRKELSDVTAFQCASSPASVVPASGGGSGTAAASVGARAAKITSHLANALMLMYRRMMLSRESRKALRALDLQLPILPNPVLPVLTAAALPIR